MSATFHLKDKTEVHDDTLNVVCKADTCTLFSEYINKRTKKWNTLLLGHWIFQRIINALNDIVKLVGFVFALLTLILYTFHITKNFKALNEEQKRKSDILMICIYYL